MELEIKDIRFGKNKNHTMRNEITFNSSIFDTNTYVENQLVELVSSKGSIICSVSYSSYDSEITAYLSFYLRNFEDGEKFIIKEMNNVDIKRYNIAKIEDLKKDKLIISNNVLESISGQEELKGVIIVNRLNGYSLQLPMDKILADYENDNRVTLNVKHRKLLDVELPTYISQCYIDMMEGTIKSHYTSEAENVKYEDYYEATREFRNTLNKYNINLLSVYPLFKSKKKKRGSKGLTIFIKNIIDRILAFFIGQRSIMLRTIRPYPIDESENLVRLSKTAMELLGLEETDTVLIKNGNLSCKARVLLIDDWDIISNENRIKSEQELSLLIGIPAYMRNELELHYINTNVFIQRDLYYFFRKHLNSQIITIISFMLSLSVFNKIDNIYIKITIMVGFLILMVYLSFSEVREKISNK